MIKTVLAILLAAAAVSAAQAAPADKGATTDALVQERQQIQPHAQAEQDALIQQRDEVAARTPAPAYVAPRVVRPVRRARRPVHHVVVHHPVKKPAPPRH